ncbi:MAG TPA: DNA-binding protein, partial [Cyanobacteria bacterium UBA11148]|nr:DNA-binding protein [Cyanobacteria bacterium UBA11148]
MRFCKNEVQLKVYLDTSALNRVFDDQSQARIYLESTSMQLIFLLIENEIIEIISSDALVFETERNPYSDRQTFVELVLQ